MSQQAMKPLTRETASQTAGPYVHIGLSPQAAGFDIFENGFGSVLTNARTAGEPRQVGEDASSCGPIGHYYRASRIDHKKGNSNGVREVGGFIGSH